MRIRTLATIAILSGVLLSLMPATANAASGDPVLSFGPSSSVLEGNTGTSTPLDFEIRLSVPSANTVSVDYATQDGRARVTDGDYVATSGTLFFAPGETSKVIHVTVQGDTQEEYDEDLGVHLTNPVGAVFGSADGWGSIHNDEAHPVVTVEGATEVTEGNSGTTYVDFVLRLSRPAVLAGTIYYGFLNVGDNHDDAQLPGIGVAVSPGDEAKVVRLAVRGDTTYEADEVLNFGITEASAFEGVGNSAPLKILNDDAPPAVSIQDAFVEDEDFYEHRLNFLVILSQPAGVDITLHYRTEDGTATVEDGDYVPVTDGAVTIGTQNTVGQISIAINGDQKVEADETFSVVITSAPGAVTDGVGVGVIRNDDASDGSSTGASAQTGSTGSPATSPPSPSATGGATPTPTPTAIPSAATATQAETTPQLTLSTDVINAGQRVLVTYAGSPGTTLQILPKTQPATAYSVIGTVTLDANGFGTTTHAPQKNTRIMARTVGGLTSVQPLIQLRSVASLNATRVGTRTYTFSGRVYPALNQRLVSLYRNGVLFAQGRTDGSGIYRITKTLAVGSYNFFVRTGNDTYNLGATSRSITLLVR